MEREHDRDDARNGKPEEVDVPTATETGIAPRPSQAEGERGEIEEDIGQSTSRDPDAG